MTKKLTFLFLALAFSCQNDDDLKIEKPINVLFTSLAKEPNLALALEQIFLKKDNGRVAASTSELETDSIIKVLQQDKKTYGYTVFLKKQSTEKSFKNLVFFRVRNGFFASVVEYTSFDSRVDYKNFSGIVVRYDLQGNKVSEGIMNGSRLVKNARAATCLMDVEHVCAEYFQNNNEYQRRCVKWVTIVTFDCSGTTSVGGGGGGGNSNPLPGTFVPDPLGGPGGANNSGDYFGGGSTQSGNPSFEGGAPIAVYVPPLIKNSISQPCLKEIIDKFISSDLDNNISQQINRIFNKSDKINLFFREASSDDNLDVAGTRVIKKTQEEFDIEIALRIQKVSLWSKEYIAKTIIHEAVHAYLLSIGYKDDQLAQHRTMVKLFIDWMQQALLEQFPQMPPRDALAVCLVGFADLFSTESDSLIYDEMIVEYGFVRGEIFDTANQYKRVNSTNVKGTLCN